MVASARERSAGRARGRRRRAATARPREVVVAGPGSQALIQALARIIPRGAVGVLGPTYGGLKAAFAAAGARVDEAKRLEDMGDLDVAIVVNPNNPGRADHAARRPPRTSRATCAARRRPDRRRSLRRFRRRRRKPGAGPALRARSCCARSASRSASPACVSASRSLRPRSSNRLRAALGEWPVSGPAIAIGTKALADRAWTEAMRDRLGQDDSAARRAARGRWLAPRRRDSSVPPGREGRRARRVRAAARGRHPRPAVRRRSRLAAVRDSGR